MAMFALGFLWVHVICIADAGAMPAPPSLIMKRMLDNRDESTFPWQFEMRYYNQTVDHFRSYAQSEVFPERYIIDRQFWHGAEDGGPIFFFTGAEGGDIVGVAGAYGHVGEVAQRLGGMVVFMEARFFGESQPFGKVRSYEPFSDRIGLLSIEQILLDYVNIISAVRDEFDSSWKCPTIAFGGSLAGTLSAMMRLKYPTIVDMALASSAPLRGYALPGVDQFAWRKQVTMNWETLSDKENCPVASLIRRGFEALQNADPEAVRTAFRTCEPPYAGNWQDVQDLFWQVLESEAEFIYPASASLIPKRCSEAARAAASSGSTGLDIAAAMLLSEGRCVNLTQFREQQREPDTHGWDYLSCTEIVHPIGCNNVTDFFPPEPWTLAGTSADCMRQWNAEPLDKGLWIPTTFGFAHPAKLAAAASRIIFAYGDLDPWHVFAISTQNLSAQLPVVMIPGGSHCADMAGSRQDDTEDMLAARRTEELILKDWISEHKSNTVQLLSTASNAIFV
eukprot:TRINITY_DN76698_c0_g1_i1.p1 TRINITY_DN76698_c0_g1~~TRINITY_DN76698_c0_g1_i1.p1  ORF type:complete len:506 (-),score=64.70 TRINITY_DN76698_c0_g1_i1:241-1758(-)